MSPKSIRVVWHLAFGSLRRISHWREMREIPYSESFIVRT